MFSQIDKMFLLLVFYIFGFNSGDGEGGTTRGNERQTLRDFMRQNFGLSAETNGQYSLSFCL